MGSSGQKPRKPSHSQHLPKVGTQPNRDYEVREKRKVELGGLPFVLAVVLIALLIVAVIAIT